MRVLHSGLKMAAFPIILIAFVAAVKASADKPVIEPETRMSERIIENQPCYGENCCGDFPSVNSDCCNWGESRRANCHPKARCIKRNGNPTCKCLPGYVSDGKFCKAPESNLEWCCKVAKLYQSKFDKEIHNTNIRSEWVQKDCDSLVPDGFFGEQTRKICKVDETCQNKVEYCDARHVDCTKEYAKENCRKFCNICGGFFSSKEKGDKCTNENKIDVGVAPEKYWKMEDLPPLPPLPPPPPIFSRSLLKMSCMPNREWCWLAFELHLRYGSFHGHPVFGDKEISDEWEFRRCRCEVEDDAFNDRFMWMCYRY